MRKRHGHRPLTTGVLILVTGLLTSVARADAAPQRAFASADAAVDALVDAAKAGDTATLLMIFGPEGKPIVASGDPVADRAGRDRFVARAGERRHLERVGDDFAVLSVGDDDWPFAIPLMKDKAGWRFDTAAGKAEILNRRIGRNELHTIHIVQEYVDAQRDYGRRMHAAHGDTEYAQRLRSTPGKRDGLYWEASADDEESPLGPRFASAAREGYAGGADGAGTQPFHGYIFKILTTQGPNAPGGAKSYIDAGRMTAGFALIAYPVEYGASGIMTFVVNQQGVVFQKDLGKNTARIAGATTRYDPDKSWAPGE